MSIHLSKKKWYKLTLISKICVLSVYNSTIYYSCPDDVDLFTGLLSERPLPGLIVGPLLQCLLMKQFKALRKGDRFFYEEKRRPTGFTKSTVVCFIVIIHNNYAFLFYTYFTSLHSLTLRINKYVFKTSKMLLKYVYVY